MLTVRQHLVNLIFLGKTDEFREVIRNNPDLLSLADPGFNAQSALGPPSAYALDLGLNPIIEDDIDVGVGAVVTPGPELDMDFDQEPDFAPAPGVMVPFHKPLFHEIAFCRHQEMFVALFEVVEELIQEGKISGELLRENMQLFDRNENTIMHLVAAMGSPKAFEYCKKYGARLDVEDGHNRTLAECAATENKIDILNCLIESDIKIDAPSSIGNTSLHHYQSGDMQDSTAIFLLKNGADINACNNENQTPFSLLLVSLLDAQKVDDEAVHRAIFLLEHGSQLKINKNGNEIELLTAVQKSVLLHLITAVQTLESKQEESVNHSAVPRGARQYLCGLLEEKTASFNQAIPYYAAAADAGHVKSFFILGNYYALKQEWDQAFKWYRHAIDLDSKNMISKLGISKTIFLAHEFSQQMTELGKVERETYYQMAMRALTTYLIQNPSEQQKLSAEDCLLLSHLVGTAGNQFDTIPEVSQRRIALKWAFEGYRRAKDPELANLALGDINHFAVLLVSTGSEAEKKYMQHFCQKSLKCAESMIDQSLDQANKLYDIANLLAGKESRTVFIDNKAKLKEAIQKDLVTQGVVGIPAKKPEAGSKDYQPHNLFTKGPKVETGNKPVLPGPKQKPEL